MLEEAKLEQELEQKLEQGGVPEPEGKQGLRAVEEQ